MAKVCKFGGSSLCSAEAFLQAKNVVLSDPERRYVVCSAIGARFHGDNKVTDLLYLAFQHQKFHVDCSPLLKEIASRYQKVNDDLGLDFDFIQEFAQIEADLKAGSITEAELVSRGEYYSAKLFAKTIGFPFLDAKELFHFAYDGQIDPKATHEAIQKALKGMDHAVIPGFYGSYPGGAICLFTRGGSDVSASYVAEAVDASLYENFTDVPGFFMADPRVIASPRKIREISYDELRELSYSGAAVLHEETILPLTEKLIPIEVLSSASPEEGGTLIKKDTPDKKHLITGLTGKKGFVALTFVKQRSAGKLESILAVLNVFASFGVPIEHIPTSIDSFSVVFDKKKVGDRFFDLVAALKGIDLILSISEDDDIALIAVVGQNMVKKPGVSGRILSVFGEEGINIKLIDQGRKEINIIVGIGNADFEKSLEALYTRFAHEKI